MPNCVIVGAGLAGLSTAYHLAKDIDYLIFEAEDRVGGLCRTEHVNGFKFDYTGHFLHFRNEQVKNLVFELMGDTLVQHARKSGIYLYDVITPYPFQINTYGHSVELIKECLSGLIEAKYSHVNHVNTEIKTFEDWILKSCGQGVAKHFMIPYNKKLWTVHPREMTTSWMGSYVPEPNLDAALDGALRAPVRSVGYNVFFYYPKEGGIEALPNMFLPWVRNLYLNSRIQSIDLKNKTILTNGKEYHYSVLVSTLPLRYLLSIIKELDPKIKRLGTLLKHNSVYTVNIGVDKEKLSDYHWLYFPEDKYIFYRVGFPSQLSPAMAPEGMGSLNAEISYTSDDPLDQSTVVQRVIQDLKLAKILHDNDRIVTTKIINIPYAYVIYDQKRDEIFIQIQSYLKEKGIISVGRYGGWQYSAMEDAIFDGIKTAKALNANRYAQLRA